MSDGFFERWSRRKQQARDVVAPAADEAEAPRVDASAVAPATGAFAPSLSPVDTVAAPVPVVPDAANEGPPPLTLADTESLTIDSDFKPFVARGVAPAVKNAAFKKLFADPHFNVMDRMDIYIDDYSIPSPLPESVLRQMASAKFLNLFEEEEEAPPATAEDASLQAAGPMPGVTPQDDGPAAMAQSEPSGDLPSPLVAATQPASQPTDDPNADLRLQPDDAARAEDARRRAG